MDLDERPPDWPSVLASAGDPPDTGWREDEHRDLDAAWAVASAATDPGTDAAQRKWATALREIVLNRRSSWIGKACLPGGSAEALVAIGAVEAVHADPRYVTLTPWGAAMLGVELFEHEDGRDPVWMRTATLQEFVKQSEGIKSAGLPGMRRLGGIDRMIADDDARQLPFSDSDGSADGIPTAAPVVDEWDVPVGIGTALGDSVPAYRDADVRAELRAKAKERRRARKAAKAGKRRAAG